MNARRAVFSLMVLVLSVAALGGCNAATGGERFAFEALAAGRAEAGQSFVNERGWTVSLRRAELSIGPLYLNAAAPLRAASGPTWWSSLVPSAYAAGEDHLQSGRVLGEVLGRVTLDALSPSLRPFSELGSATTEQVRTADVWLYPPPGVSAEATKNVPPSLSVAGLAQRGDERVLFRGDLILNDSWLPEALPGSRASRTVMSLRQVRGIAASLLPSAGGHLEVFVDVRSFFRGADFGSLTTNKRDADGTYVLSQSLGGTDQVMNNLYQGLRSVGGVYDVRWSNQN